MFETFSIYQLIALIVVISLNVYTCFLYYADKQRAIKRQPRIPEKTMLLSTFALGGIGAWIGMTRFRHKTKKLKFRISVPAASVITLAALYYILSGR